MFKWAEISLKKSERYELLSAVLSELGINNQFQHFSSQVSNLGELIETVKKDHHSIRFGFELWDSLSDHVNQTYTQTLRLRAVDAIYLDSKDGWWPHLSFDDAISYYLSDYEKSLVTTDPVFVIGSGGLARAVISGLIKMGYAKINIACINKDEALQIQNDFQKIFFNTTFSYTERDNVTLLPGVHNIVINTLDFPEKDEFLRDLYYFNFLKKNGIVVDLNEVPIETPLTYIAKDINAKIIYGYEVLSYGDFLWARIATQKELDWKSYQKRIAEKLSSYKVAEDVIKQILEEFQIKS